MLEQQQAFQRLAENLADVAWKQNLTDSAWTTQWIQTITINTFNTTQSIHSGRLCLNNTNTTIIVKRCTQQIESTSQKATPSPNATHLCWTTCITGFCLAWSPFAKSQPQDKHAPNYEKWHLTPMPTPPSLPPVYWLAQQQKLQDS